jgi:hypothetical protein
VFATCEKSSTQSTEQKTAIRATGVTLSRQRWPVGNEVAKISNMGLPN